MNKEVFQFKYNFFYKYPNNKYNFSYSENFIPYSPEELLQSPLN